MTRTDEEWTKLVRGWQAHPPSWPEDAGPPPQSLGCNAPHHILTACGALRANAHNTKVMPEPIEPQPPPNKPKNEKAPRPNGGTDTQIGDHDLIPPEMKGELGVLKLGTEADGGSDGA